MNIVKARKVSVENYSPEIISNAIEKCSFAENYIQRSITTKKNQGFLLDAVNLYQESIDLYPKLAEPYIGLAYIFFITGDLKNSIALIYNAIDLEPSNKKANEMLTYYQNEFNKSRFPNQNEKIQKDNTQISDQIKDEFKSKSITGRLDFTGVKVNANKGFIANLKKY